MTDALDKRLMALAELEHNWDSYGALPISMETLCMAEHMIKATDVPGVQIVPGSDGSVQLEWHTKELDMEIWIKVPEE